MTPKSQATKNSYKTKKNIISASHLRHLLEVDSQWRKNKLTVWSLLQPPSLCFRPSHANGATQGAWDAKIIQARMRDN